MLAWEYFIKAEGDPAFHKRRPENTTQKQKCLKKFGIYYREMVYKLSNLKKIKGACLKRK